MVYLAQTIPLLGGFYEVSCIRRRRHGSCLAAFFGHGWEGRHPHRPGRHRDAIEKNGLVLETSHGTFAVPIPSFEQENYNQQPDVIFVCVKGYSLEGILPTLKRLCRPETIVIPILNVWVPAGPCSLSCPSLWLPTAACTLPLRSKPPAWST